MIFGLRRLMELGTWRKEWDNQLSGDAVHALAADQEGQLWVATEGKLSKLSNDEWTHFDADYTYLASEAKGIAVDHQGRVWIADLFYIGNLSPEGRWEKSVYRLDYIRSITIDDQSSIWTRTQG